MKSMFNSWIPQAKEGVPSHVSWPSLGLDLKWQGPSIWTFLFSLTFSPSLTHFHTQSHANNLNSTPLPPHCHLTSSLGDSDSRGEEEMVWEKKREDLEWECLPGARKKKIKKLILKMSSRWDGKRGEGKQFKKQHH